MDALTEKIKKYQTILIGYLEELADERNNASAQHLEYQVIADTTRNHFQLVRMGWIQYRYVHLVLLHFDIKPDGEIWLQLNNTEILVDRYLIALGVDPADFVIGFQPEYVRQQAVPGAL